MSRKKKEQFSEDSYDLSKIGPPAFIDPKSSQIQFMHTVFPINSILPLLQETTDITLNEEIKNIINEINASDADTAQYNIRKLALKYQPKKIKDLIWLYKLGITEFFIEGSTYDFEVQNLLNDIFKINVNFETNPLLLHLITTEMLELQCFNTSYRNKIYFAKIMNPISRLALYFSVCIIWNVFYTILAIKQKMCRFYKFSDLVQNLKNVNFEDFHDKEEDLYYLLECTSYLLNIMTDRNIKEKIDTSYLDYFLYNKEDISTLKLWCINLNRNFDVKPLDANYNVDGSFISDLLELDIIVALENMEGANFQEDFE